MKIERVDANSVNPEMINALLAYLHFGSERQHVSAAELAETLQDPLHYLLVAKYSEGPDTKSDTSRYFGMGSIYFKRIVSKWTAHIDDVVVESRLQGTGVGKLIVMELIQTARQFCTERNVSLALKLSSRPNRIIANEMYVKLGFELVARGQSDNGSNHYRLMIEPEGSKGLP